MLTVQSNITSLQLMSLMPRYVFFCMYRNSRTTNNIFLALDYVCFFNKCEQSLRSMLYFSSIIIPLSPQLIVIYKY